MAAGSVGKKGFIGIGLVEMGKGEGDKGGYGSALVSRRSGWVDPS
jgi:hypothetical protein